MNSAYWYPTLSIQSTPHHIHLEKVTQEGKSWESGSNLGESMDTCFLFILNQDNL